MGCQGAVRAPVATGTAPTSQAARGRAGGASEAGRAAPPRQHRLVCPPLAPCPHDYVHNCITTVTLLWQALAWPMRLPDDGLVCAPHEHTQRGSLVTPQTLLSRRLPMHHLSLGTGKNLIQLSLRSTHALWSQQQPTTMPATFYTCYTFTAQLSSSPLTLLQARSGSSSGQVVQRCGFVYDSAR